MVSYDFEKPVLYIVSDKEFGSRSKLKGLISKWGMLSPARLPRRGSRNFVRTTSSLQGSGRGIHYFPGGPLANFYGNLYTCNLNVVFKGMKVRTPSLHSDLHMLLL